MSIQYFTPNSSTNLIYDGVYANLDHTELSNAVNQDAYLKNDNTGTLIWVKKNVANGVPELDANGLIPTTMIPQRYDDIREYATFSDFPVVGDDTNGIIYYAVDTGNFYKWNTGTSSYLNLSTINFYNKTQIDSSLALKLNKAGDTMGGNLNMGNFDITNCNNATVAGQLNLGYNSLFINGQCMMRYGAYLEIQNTSVVYAPSSTVLCQGLISPNSGSCFDFVADQTKIKANKQLNMNSNAILNCPSINATSGAITLNGVSGGGANINGDLNMLTNNISSVATLSATTVNASSSTITTTNATTANIGTCNISGTINIPYTGLYINGNRFLSFGGGIECYSSIYLGTNGLQSCGYINASNYTNNFDLQVDLTKTYCNKDIHLNSHSLLGVSSITTPYGNAYLQNQLITSNNYPMGTGNVSINVGNFASNVLNVEWVSSVIVYYCEYTQNPDVWVMIPQNGYSFTFQIGTPCSAYIDINLSAYSSSPLSIKCVVKYNIS